MFNTIPQKAWYYKYLLWFYQAEADFFFVIDKMPINPLFTLIFLRLTEFSPGKISFLPAAYISYKKYLADKIQLKYPALTDTMKEIVNEDVCKKLFIVFPPVNAILFRQNAGFEYRFFNALFFLLFVVFERNKCNFTEQQNGNNVRRRHQCHEQVGKVPYKTEFGNGAEKYHARNEYAEDIQIQRIIGQIFNIYFTVVIIADNGSKGEQNDEYCYGGNGDVAEIQRQIVLHQLNTGKSCWMVIGA